MTTPAYDIGAILTGAVVGWAAAGRPKAQAVRLVDVWLLGPLMVYVAATADEPDDGLQELARQTLTAAGAATITYNGRNYLRNPSYPPGTVDG